MIILITTVESWICLTVITNVMLEVACYKREYRYLQRHFWYMHGINIQISITTEMCSLFMLMLILQLSISFPAVAGDCYDKPSNNKSYENCATCYQTLANALLNTGDNKYQLGRAFFPDDTVPPVVVKAVYVIEEAQDNTTNLWDSEGQDYTTNWWDSEAQDNTTNLCDGEQLPDDIASTWYWLTGEMYIYQVMEIFSYRSLFFSPPSWRQKCVVLSLPEPCLLMNESHTFEEFFMFLTQRVCCPHYHPCI